MLCCPLDVDVGGEKKEGRTNSGACRKGVV
jgi:hypothetical protein